MRQLIVRLREPLAVSAGVTLAVAGIALGLPERAHTTLVGFVFLAATWALVWRKDDEHVRRYGLALGGLVIPGKLDAPRMLRDTGIALAWSLGLMAVIAVPFFFGWRAWFGHVMPRLSFSLTVTPAAAANEVLGQLFVIALPEEAFYRGYLQSRLDEVWPPRWRVLGAVLGPGWLVTAAIFAVGHLATIPAPSRLAVFFPALVFGWLRARTGGIGASMLFHALCNVYSQALGRGFGVY
jgi:membrane protease YdiL (CAAX protease family)